MCVFIGHTQSVEKTLKRPQYEIYILGLEIGMYIWPKVWKTD